MDPWNAVLLYTIEFCKSWSKAWPKAVLEAPFETRISSDDDLNEAVETMSTFSCMISVGPAGCH